MFAPAKRDIVLLSSLRLFLFVWVRFYWGLDAFVDLVRGSKKTLIFFKKSFAGLKRGCIFAPALRNKRSS